VKAQERWHGRELFRKSLVTQAGVETFVRELSLTVHGVEEANRIEGLSFTSHTEHGKAVKLVFFMMTGGGYSRRNLL
jgi:hypothetical protein